MARETQQGSNPLQESLDLARRTILASDTVSAVVVKDGKILTVTMGQGVQPLIDLLHRLGKEVRGAVLGDKIVGRAPAWVAVAHQIAGVYARLITPAAREILQRHGIAVDFRDETPVILSPDGATPCPLEVALESVSELGEALEVLRAHPLVTLP